MTRRSTTIALSVATLVLGPAIFCLWAVMSAETVTGSDAGRAVAIGLLGMGVTFLGGTGLLVWSLRRPANAGRISREGRH